MGGNGVGDNSRPPYRMSGNALRLSQELSVMGATLAVISAWIKWGELWLLRWQDLSTAR